MQDKLFLVGQKAVIKKGRQILLLHDPKFDSPDLPGGKIQQGEKDFLRALQREVSEETGLKIKINEPFTTGYFLIPKNSRHPSAGKEIFLIYYRCEYQEGEIKLSKEHDWYKWVDKNNYRHYLPKGNDIRKALDKYFKVES